MSAAQGELLTVDGVVAGYGAAEQILKGTSLKVAPGEIVPVTGHAADSRALLAA